MLEGITGNAGFVLVFIEGVLSFFSPCVIPLIPVYMSYLAGSGKIQNPDGTITYQRKKVFLHTLFFVLGISFAFFILGMSFSALGRFFSTNKILITRIGGIIIIFLGLFQLGVFDFKFLNRNRKFNLKLADKKMNPFLALIMGFTFSFAWTPCVGPALSSVLIMASGATSAFTGNLLVFIYSLGFLIPFLLLGLFTSQILNFLKSRQKFLKYTVKVAGVILILIGIMLFTGWMNNVTGYLNKVGVSSSSDAQQENQSTNESPQEDVIPAFDFTLVDQYGNEHTLSDYKGKVVFMNFWATWCPPCKKELPDIESIYKEYGLNEEDVVILGITNPSSRENPSGQDGTKEEILAFIQEGGYTFPVLFDETGAVFQNYQISAFPTTFMVDIEGNVFGFVPGMMTKEIMKNIISQTQNAGK